LQKGDLVAVSQGCRGIDDLAVDGEGGVGPEGQDGRVPFFKEMEEILRSGAFRDVEVELTLARYFPV